MLKAKSIRRILAVILSCAVVMAALLVPVTVSAEDSAEIISGTLVNGDMEDGSWYAWAGDEVLYGSYTGNDLNGEVTSTDRKFSGSQGMQFVRDSGSYPSTGPWGESETIAGCKTTIDEAKFAQMDLSDMTFSIWAYVEHTDLTNKFFILDVKYRAVKNNGTYGSYHTASLRSSVTEGMKWVQVSAKLDDMWGECADAKTIEVELFTRSYCSVYLDEADITASKADPSVVKGSLINGGMEEGSWYAWAGDQVLYGGYTGTALDALVSSTDRKYSGAKGMQFIRDQGFYPSTGDWGESETIAGCKTTIDEAKFAQMDLSDMTFSIWAYVDVEELKKYGGGNFFAFNVKYRAVNNNGTYGEYHTADFMECITAGETWTQATAELDDMWAECANAKTIEFEIYTSSYCSVYLDEADVTASNINFPVVNRSLVNGGMEDGSWYAWAGDEALDGGHTGNALNGEVVTTDKKYSGSRGMQFVRGWSSYPIISANYNLSEMIAGCKTTIKEGKLPQMDLSDMTFSIWINAEGGFATFNVKYRAVNNDGTYGNYHTAYLSSSITTYNTWIQVTTKLDDMTSECADAKTIEFELYAESYYTFYVDEADVTASRIKEAHTGDVTGNGGAADAEDIKAVKMFLLRVENIDTYDYDVNGDGEINVLDLVKLKKLMCGIA